MGDLALALGAYPLDFVEKYFPTRLAVDSLLGGDPADYPDGTSRRPILTITAGDGPNLGAGVPIDHEVVAAGYDHLDVLTAAPEQNDGRPEIVATSLLEFVMSH